MIDLKQSLIDEQSIRLQMMAADWQEAIQLAVAPLVESGAVSLEYQAAIIASTEKYGPYYILCPYMAMPHARPEDGVNRNAFSLVTLQRSVVFKGGQEVSILVTLAATSADIHLGKAIPQIIALFELDHIVERLGAATTDQEIYELIDQTKDSKYLAHFI